MNEAQFNHIYKLPNTPQLSNSNFFCHWYECNKMDRNTHVHTGTVNNLK